jgi:hypothetical protein
MGVLGEARQVAVGRGHVALLAERDGNGEIHPLGQKYSSRLDRTVYEKTLAANA